MQVDNLIIEVGRKCNLCCEHCLRGKSEDVAIDVGVAMIAIKKFTHIDCIVFTGGEPVLYAKEIIQIIDFIIDNKIEVYNFYIASNGKAVNMKLMMKLVEFYAYIGGNDGIPCYEISSDQFHEKIPEKTRSILSAFSFTSYRNNIPQTGIISEGNAEENGLGYRYLDYSKKFYVYDDEDCVDMVYVNAFGNIYPECDYSYETQRNLPNISVLNGYNIETLIKNYDEEISK